MKKISIIVCSVLTLLSVTVSKVQIPTIVTSEVISSTTIVNNEVVQKETTTTTGADGKTTTTTTTTATSNGAAPADLHNDTTVSEISADITLDSVKDHTM